MSQNITMQAYTNRHIWKITYPLLISLLMENLIGLTDVAFLGRVGDVELGASALAGIYFMAIFMLGFGFSIGVQILIARRNGEGRPREIGKIFQQGLLFLLCFAAAMFFVSKQYTPRLLRTLIESDAVYAAAVAYLDWRVYGFFFSFAAVLFRAFYVGTTNTRLLTANSIIMVLTNIVLNYILIFGKLGCPALGIAGAAIASSIAELSSLLFFAIHTRMHGYAKRYGLFSFQGFNLSILTQIFNVSIWTMLQATSTLMGKGEYDQVMPTVRQIIGLAYRVALPVMILICLFPSVVLRLYTNDLTLIAASVGSLWVMVAGYLTLIPGSIYFNAVSGTGNSFMAMLMELGALALYVLSIWWIIILHRPSITLCWTVDIIYSIGLLLFTYLYLVKANWRNKKI